MDYLFLMHFIGQSLLGLMELPLHIMQYLKNLFLLFLHGKQLFMKFSAFSFILKQSMYHILQYKKVMLNIIIEESCEGGNFTCRICHYDVNEHINFNKVLKAFKTNDKLFNQMIVKTNSYSSSQTTNKLQELLNKQTSRGFVFQWRP